MSRNGSGTYSLPAGNPVVTGTTISSTWANNTLTDIATALTGSLAADGQTTATGNLKMGSNRITGLADGIATTDAATVNQIPDTTIFLLKASNLSDVANATTARGNLTAAKSGANSDITSLTGLTTALSAAQGGTGLTAPGTSGNVLTSNGSAWVSSTPSSGKVLQVVSVNDTTQYVFNSGSTPNTTYYSVTNLVVSITPSSTSNKILVLSNITAGQTSNAYNAFFRVTRNGTAVGVGNASGYYGTSTTGFRASDAGAIGTAAIMYLDSPATTSSVTYQIQICNSGGSSYPSYVNRPQSTGGGGWEFSGASSIIVMEIA
jgi:hypothetical protein